MFVALEDNLFVFEMGRKTNSFTRGGKKWHLPQKPLFGLKCF